MRCKLNFRVDMFNIKFKYKVRKKSFVLRFNLNLDLWYISIYFKVKYDFLLSIYKKIYNFV